MHFKAFALAATLLAGLAQPVLGQVSDYDWVVNIRNDSVPILPAGAEAGYLVTVFNDSLFTAPPTTIDILVPAGTTFNSASGLITGCAELVAGTVTCNVPTLASDTVATLDIGFLTTAAGVIEVTARIPAPDADPGNNEALIRTTLTRGADVSVGVTGTVTVPAGGAVSYTVTATNLGPYATDSFLVEFPVPTGMSAVVAPPGCTLAGTAYECLVSTPLAVGGTLDFVFSGFASTAANSTITVVAAIIDVAPEDPDISNNITSFNTAVTEGSDVKIAKSRAPAGPLVVGNTVTFTLSPSYSGDVPSGLTITDTLPANYAIIPPVVSGAWSCSVSGQTVTCTLPAGTVPGGNVSLGEILIQASVVSPGTATNVTNISSTGPFDPDLSNNTADDGGVVIVPPTIDLAISKSGPQPPLVVVGNSYDYTLGATNLGNTGYYGTVRIEDFLPAGLQATAVGGPGWTCAPAMPLTGPATITCERVYTATDPLPPGGRTPDITLTATVLQQGAIRNEARVSAILPNLPDNNPGNDTTNTDVGGSTPGNSADISVLKAAARATLAAGDEQVFTIEIGNSGSVASQNVVMTDLLSNLVNNSTGPADGYVSSVQTPGVAVGFACTTSAAGPQAVLQTCTIDSLPICTIGLDCPKIEITVRPGTNGGSRTNTANVGSSTTADPVLTNNSASISYTVEPRADVTVSKNAAPLPVAAGQELVFIVSATNLANGLSRAENVTITDILAPNLTFLAAEPTSGSCSSTPIVGSVTTPGNDLVQCNLGTLDNGAQQNVRITVRANQIYAGGSVLNSVAVTTSTTETDPNNNEASITVPVNSPAYDILVGKSDNIDPVAVGEDTVYRIRVGNRGPSTAENVVVTDTLPPSLLSFQSLVVPPDAICSPLPAPGTIGGSFSCTFPFLARGQVRDLDLTMRGVTKGVAVNRATVAADGSNSFDTQPANNQTSQATTVRTRADVAVTRKAPSDATPDLGENLNFAIRVENLAGPVLSEADFVVLSDTLPTGMVLTGPPTASLVSGSSTTLACTGVSSAVSFTCAFGTMTSGAIIDVTVPVRVNSVTSNPQTLTNTANVTTTSLDVNLANNSNSGSVAVQSSSLAGRVFRDFNDNGVFDANDTGIGGVTMTLSGTTLNGAPFSPNVTTAANGTYTFTLLPQGTYTLVQGPISELNLDPRAAIPGTAGGVSAGPTQITAINLPGNTAATAYLFPKVPQATIAAAKRVVGTPAVQPDGSVNIPFRFVLRNFSLEPVKDMQLVDPLAGPSPLFGTYAPPTLPLAPGSYTVTAIGGTCAGLNPAFNGSSDQVLVSGLRLLRGADCVVNVTLRVQPNVPLPVLASTAVVNYLNQGTLTGTGEWSGQTPATNPGLSHRSNNGSTPNPARSDPTPVRATFTPTIRLVKTADTIGIIDPKVGDIISYAFTITNTGNITLTDVTLTDKLPGIVIAPTAPIPVLVPGQVSTVFTATYALTQADLNAGEVENQATATGTWGRNPNGQPLTVNDLSGTDQNNNNPTVVKLGAIDLLKSVDTSGLSSPPAAGDTLTFSFAITNTGPSNLTNVTVTDPLLGAGLTGSPIPVLAPGATNTTAYTGTYQLTQADVDAGVLTNTAAVTGRYASDGAGGFLTVSDTSSTTTPLTSAPAIALIKLADDAAITDPALPGQQIIYSFTVKNTGNVTLTNVTVTDPVLGLTLTGSPIPSLAPGAEDSTTFSATYPITQADIDAGQVLNSALATGTYVSPTGDVPATDISGSAFDNDDPTIVPLVQAPAITLVKTADDSGISDPAVLGEIISYSFTITNTGNVTLTGVTVDDLLPGIVISGSPIASLAPGQIDTSITATYALTQADLDAGLVQNSATTTGTFTDATGTPGTVIDDAQADVPVVQSPGITLVKTADASAVTDPAVVGQQISYSFAIENTGNVTLTDVTLTDLLPGIVISGSPIASLAPGVVDTSITGTYALTQADLDAGFVDNQATTTGTYIDATTGAPGTVTDDSAAGVPIPQGPAITLVKTADASAVTNPALVGQQISYAFTITNTGNVTLTDIALTDILPGIVISGSPIASLAPGQVDTSFTATYALTQADIDAERVANTATATGTFTDAAGVPGTVSNDSSTETILGDNPLIALIKTADASAVTSPALPGQVITYAFTVTNTGNVTLTDITLQDVLPGLVLSGGPIPVLAPNGVDGSTFTGTYALTQADIDAGRVENSATVTGIFNDPFTGPEDVTDVSGSDNTNDDPTVVPLVQAPAITLVKTADTSAVTVPAVVGQQISYSFTITNTGNVTLTDVTLDDPLPGIVITGGPIATLAPGASDALSFTATYALTQADLDAGLVQNTATTTGTFSDATTGAPGTVTDDAQADAPILQSPGIGLVKAVSGAGLQSPPQVGDVLTYTFAVTNTGNVTLTNVTLTDILPGIIITGGPIATLAPGATDASTFTATYALTQADLDAAQVTNQATATGTFTTPGGPDTVDDQSGTTLGDDDPTVIDLAPAPGITLVKTVDTASLPDPANVGDTLSYAFTVTNSGNVTLTNIIVTDALPGIVISGGPIPSLAPGGVDSTTFTASYAITQADLDAGIVINTAVTTGTFTGVSGVPGTVSDTSGTEAGNNTPTEAPLPARPGIAVVKSADTSGMSGPNRLGDPITYRFAVTNTGNVTLSDVTLTDPLPGLTLTGGPIPSLAPGETDTTTFVGTYSLVESDFNNERVVNQATVSGNPPTGPPVTDLSGETVLDDNPTVVPLTFQPNVTASKIASTTSVVIGDSFSYALAFSSNTPGTLRNMTVIDVLPVGLVYTPGSARVDGVAQEPLVTGRTLRWTGVTIGANATVTVRLSVRVTGDAPWGEMENQTWLESGDGERVSNVATATVVREPEQVFDCADIIGKVFDDRNGNGYQDGPEGNATEPGLPGVRVVTTRGYIVTTDDFGRFHVPCAELPKSIGSNFTMKLDTRSLPTGYRLTSENPRTIRVTPGKMAKLNFAAALSRVVRIDLNARAFTDDGQPSDALRAGISGLVQQLQSQPSVLRLNYQLSGESDATARRRLARVEALVRDAWSDDGGRLKVERTLQRGKVAK